MSFPDAILRLVSQRTESAQKETESPFGLSGFKRIPFTKTKSEAKTASNTKIGASGRLSLPHMPIKEFPDPLSVPFKEDSKLTLRRPT